MRPGICHLAVACLYLTGSLIWLPVLSCLRHYFQFQCRVQLIEIIDLFQHFLPIMHDVIIAFINRHQHDRPTADATTIFGHWPVMDMNGISGIDPLHETIITPSKTVFQSDKSQHR